MTRSFAVLGWIAKAVVFERRRIIHSGTDQAGCRKWAVYVQSIVLQSWSREYYSWFLMNLSPINPIQTLGWWKSIHVEEGYLYVVTTYHFSSLFSLLPTQKYHNVVMVRLQVYFEYLFFFYLEDFSIFSFAFWDRDSHWTTMMQQYGMSTELKNSWQGFP